MKHNIKTEIIAGLTTFCTMAYIVIVNPQLMATPGTGMALAACLTATVIISALMSLIAGIYIKLPYALAPGMGINAFFVYSMILGQGISWPTALGVVFWSSVLFILISVFPIRKKIVEALPDNMKHALACGIGLFLAFIGLKNMGLVVSHPTTFVTLGMLDTKVVLSLLGFLVAFYLFYKQKPYAFLASILVVSGLALALGLQKFPEVIFDQPDFTTLFGKLDLVGSLHLSLIPVILTLLLTNLFDSVSAVIGLATSAKFLDEKGNPMRLKQTLLVDSVGSMASSIIGTPPVTVFIESAAGIQLGGRTGVVSIVVALCFIPCLFLAPLISVIPIYATAPILVFLGVLMLRNITHIKATTMDDIIPIFLTVLLMPLTFSVTQGVLWGIVSYVLLKVLVGKARLLSPVLWCLAFLCLSALVLEYSSLLHGKA